MIGLSVRLLSNRFAHLSAAQKAALDRVRLKTALRIETDWKADVRVDTGNYRRSIHTEDGPTQTVVSSNVDYAVFNEYGTSRMAAKPSARQTAEKHRRGYADDAAAAVRGAG